MNAIAVAPEVAVIPEWTVGDRLRKAREAVGLGQVEFAVETGISRSSINRYENGDVAPPRSMLLLWEMRTRVPAEWLTTGCTPRDLNPEPTVSGEGVLAQVISIDSARSIRVAMVGGGEAA